jgi:hypothetical protein
MKILLFILTFLVIGKFTRSQDTISTAGIKSYNVTWSNVYDDTKSALNSLGSALKVGSEHVYQTLVKQQPVDSIIECIEVLILFITTFIFWTLFLKDRKRFSKKGDQWYGDSLDDHEVTCAYLVISIGLLITTLIVIGCNISSIITGFVNPEYGAIKDIMNIIHPK